MIIAGIDYSLNGPAICIFNGDGEFDFAKCMFYFLTDTKRLATRFDNIIGERFSEWDQEAERYSSIADWAVSIVVGCESVGLEGYAFNATGRIFNIAENTGVLKYKLYQSGVPLSIFTPSEIKKYASGKGNAGKEQMYEAFLAETGKDIKKIMTPNIKDIGNPVSDIVDAFYVCKRLYFTMKVQQKNC